MTRSTDTMERWFDAFNAHDVEVLLELAHPEIEILPLPNAVSSLPGTSYHGHDGLRTLLGAAFDRWTLLQMTPGIMDSDGDWVIVPITFVLDDGVAPPTSRSGATVFRLAGGLVRRLRAFDSDGEAQAFVDGSGARVLTPREREIIELLADGMTAEQVAESLVISPFTVRTHVRNAKEKLGARTTGHAIAKALRSTDV